MSEPKLTYGLSLQTQRLVSIASVPNGKECGLVCPECKQPLVAKKGHKQDLGRGHAPHFAHLVEGICSPQKAFESEIHLLAKQIIFDTKKVAVPAYKGKFIAFEGTLVKFSKVLVEQPDLNDLRPDCIGTCATKLVGDYIQQQDLWIEIHNTHAVDSKKLAIIRNKHIFCIEIDVAVFAKESTLDVGALTNYLHTNIDSKKRRWINCPWDTLEMKKLVMKHHKPTQAEIRQQQWEKDRKRFQEEEACRRVCTEQNKVKYEVLQQERLARIEKEKEEKRRLETLKTKQNEASETLRIEKEFIEDVTSREKDYISRGYSNINYYLNRSKRNLEYAKKHNLQELIELEEKVAIPLLERILSQVED